MLLFFSGGECSSHISKLTQVGAKYIQLSYFHLKEKRVANPSIFDSGAQVLVSAGTFAMESVSQEFLQEYVDFLLQHSSKIFVAEYLPLPAAAGAELVKAYKKLGKSGLQLIHMWDPKSGMESWESLCKDLDYVGIPPLDLSLTQQISMLQIARKYRTKVHAFGMEKPEWWVKVPYYSVTCSRWLNGEKFGAMFYWDNKEMIEYRNTEKDSRKRHKTRLEVQGFNFDKIMADDVTELGKVNAFAWEECCIWANKRTVLKQYWDFSTSAEPKKPAIRWGEVPNGRPCVSDPEYRAAQNASKEPETVSQETPKQENVSQELMEVTNVEKLTEQERALGMTRSQLVRQKSMLCDSCYAAGRCKFYEATKVCQLNKEFLALSPSRNPKEVVEKIKMLMGSLEERTNRALYFEAVDGGMPDKNATDLVKTLIDYNMKLHDILREKSKSKETVMLSGDNLLTKIFGGKKDKVIEVVTPAQDAEVLDNKP